MTSRLNQRTASTFGANDIAPEKTMVSGSTATSPNAPGANWSVSTPLTTTSTRVPGATRRIASASTGDTTVTMSAVAAARRSRVRATSPRIRARVPETRLEASVSASMSSTSRPIGEDGR